MKYEWLDEWCLSLKGTKKDFKPEWDATRFMLKNKIYALLFQDNRGRPIINVKLDPMMGDLMRMQYIDIVPAYHMNKEHWSSVYLDGDVPDDVLRGLLTMSYKLVLASLTKKQRAEIESMEGECGS